MGRLREQAGRGILMARLYLREARVSVGSTVVSSEVVRIRLPRGQGDGGRADDDSRWWSTWPSVLGLVVPDTSRVPAEDLDGWAWDGSASSALDSLLHGRGVSTACR